MLKATAQQAESPTFGANLSERQAVGTLVVLDAVVWVRVDVKAVRVGTLEVNFGGARPAVARTIAADDLVMSLATDILQTT